MPVPPWPARVAALVGEYAISFTLDACRAPDDNDGATVRSKCCWFVSSRNGWLLPVDGAEFFPGPFSGSAWGMACGSQREEQLRYEILPPVDCCRQSFLG